MRNKKDHVLLECIEKRLTFAQMDTQETLENIKPKRFDKSTRIKKYRQKEGIKYFFF